MKKTRKQMAAEIGVSVKTLWGWEKDLWLPIFGKDKLTAKGFVLDPFHCKNDGSNATGQPVEKL